MRETLPVKAELRYQFEIGWWTDPKDGQRRQIWIPVVWLEYENGAVKPLDIHGIVREEHGVTILPLGPITYSERRQRGEGDTS